MPDTLQPVYTPFSAGIDTQSHPQNIRAPYLRHAQNVDFRRDVGPQKREGLASLSREVLGGGTITNGGQLLTVGDELLCADDQAVYSWSPQNQRWVGRGELRPVIAGTRPLAVSGAQVTAASATSMPAAGLDGCAWVDAAGVHVCVVDTASGARVVDDLLAVAGRTVCRLVASNTYFVLFTMDGAGNVYSSALRLGQGTMTPEVLVAPTVQGASQAFWDVAPDTVTDGIVLAYAPSGSGQYNLRVLRADGTPYGSLSTTSERVGVGADLTTFVTLLTIATDVAAGFTGEAARVVMVSRAYTGNGTGYYGCRIEWLRGPVSTASPRPFDVPASGLGSLPNQALAIATVQLDPVTQNMQTLVTCAVTDPLFPSFVLTYQVVTIFSQVPFSAVILPGAMVGVRLLSRPFVFGPQQRQVVWCLSGTLDLTLTVPQQPTAFLMDVASRTFMARLAIGTLDSATLLGGVQLQQPVLRGTTWATGALVRVRSVSGAKGTPGAIAGGTLVPQSGAFQLLATPATGRQLQAASLDSTGIFASGVTYQYDGASVIEQGFFEAPNLTSGGSSTGSGTLGPGTYQWVALWEWYDARGKRHRSAPSTPVSATIPAGNNWSAAFFCTPLRLTRKRNVALVLYRTTANGVVFFQVTDSTVPYLNNQAVNFLFPVDGLPDSAIQGNEVLYTGGGELPNDAPPASTVAVRARSRILLAGGEYPDTITYSKQNDVGNGVQFSLGLQKRIAAVPGSIVAMAALDDKVIVFKTQGICAFAGTGVTSAGVAAGQNDDFSDPVILATDLFCSGANAVTTANEGVYFQSQKGIYLIDRSLGFTYVGAAAEAFNSQTVVSAQLHPRLGHVRFGCLENNGLIYHPRKVQPFGDSAPQAGAWTTYTNWAGVSAAVWQGKYVLLRADGTVLLDATTYDDDGVPVIQSLRTGWLTGTAALQAARFGALAVIGQLTSPHRLQVDLAISYDATPVARLVFDTALSALRSPWGSDPAWGNAPAWGQDTIASYVFRCRELPEQVMAASAVQWTFTDAAPTDGTTLQRATSLHGYAMLVEPMAALPSLPDKQSL